MKLNFSDRCEQGTDRGAMVFRKGGLYDCAPQGDGTFVVSHEPRTERQRVDGKPVMVTVTQTVVPQAIVDKLLQFGPVAKQE